MVRKKISSLLKEELKNIRDSGLYKEERLILTPQGAAIRVKQGEVINFCANNYLGLANHPEIRKAAVEGVGKYGYGMASVRFICGTQDLHKKLESSIARFMHAEDAILYSSCFDANTGLFEALLTDQDAIISDQLNHASVIDGIRLCKAERRRFLHMDMGDLEKHLKETQSKRLRMVATDGVFSMDGDVAPLKEITQLAEQYDAIVMVDDSHATGFFGPTGRGSAEFLGVTDKIDITTSTMGKAMGGATGGFTASSSEIVDYLRNKSRPYLFSNSLAPPIVYASLKALELIEKSQELRKKLMDNTQYFRKEMQALGFNIRGSMHPIVPVMLGDAQLAQDMSKAMLSEGIYVIGFSYPVVPHGEARIRVQLSAAHSKEELDKALAAFEKVGKKFHVI